MADPPGRSCPSCGQPARTTMLVHREARKLEREIAEVAATISAIEKAPEVALRSLAD